MNSQSRQPEPWVPPCGPTIELQPAGRWWDAVRVQGDVAEMALDLLSDRSGAVIEDYFGDISYWLVEPGAADDWDLPGVEVRGDSCHVAVPPPLRTIGPGLHWRVPLAPSRYLTDAALLRDTLALAIDRVHGPCGADAARRAGR
ncbi:hypothetical protein [Streptomyces lasiicapitis]|uniref:hypothetical protein n=1 Tax=Streptomyces lasiicapitis TaxID=1923961 RepID=UPI003649399B